MGEDRIRTRTVNREKDLGDEKVGLQVYWKVSAMILGGVLMVVERGEATGPFDWVDVTE